MSFYNPYGLLNASSEFPGDTNENSSLYTVEYLLKKDDAPVLASLIKYYEMCKKDRPGLYNQLPFFAGNNDDYMSHDQLTGMFAASKKFGLNLHDDIWSEVKRQGFRYNNMTPDSPGLKGLLHPRDIIVYGMVAGSCLWWLFYPILLIIMIISQFGSETSGKLLNWVRCTAFGWNKTLWILEKFMPYKSWKEVFAVYFPDPEHPINKLWE
jgi:hypothetical protein